MRRLIASCGEIALLDKPIPSDIAVIVIASPSIEKASRKMWGQTEGWRRPSEGEMVEGSIASRSATFCRKGVLAFLFFRGWD